MELGCIEPGVALREAVQRLEAEGSLEEMQVMALRSIAWSLAGLLGAVVDGNGTESLTEALENGGFVSLSEKSR